MFETNIVINNPEPFLKMLWDFIKEYDQISVKRKPIYFKNMFNYSNCGKH